MQKVVIAGIFKDVQNYINALTAVGLEPVVTLETDNTDDYAGLLLPGGGDIDPALFGQENRGSENINTSLDKKQLSVFHRFNSDGKPILGICKGHQIINVALGGTIIQHLPTAEKHTAYDGDSVHELVCSPGNILYELYGQRFYTNSSHHQGLDRLGQGLSAVASSRDGVIEAVIHENGRILGLQWHPERMCYSKLREDTVDASGVFEWFKSIL